MSESKQAPIGQEKMLSHLISIPKTFILRTSWGRKSFVLVIVLAWPRPFQKSASRLACSWTGGVSPESLFRKEFWPESQKCAGVSFPEMPHFWTSPKRVSTQTLLRIFILLFRSNKRFAKRKEHSPPTHTGHCPQEHQGPFILLQI